MKRLRNSILKYLLVALFISYYIGGVAFTHVHHFSTYTIIHSHPYWPGADGQPHHTHNTVDYNTIEQLTEFLLEATPFIDLGCVWVLLFLFTTPHTYRTFLPACRRRNLRAPPVFR